MIYLSKEGIRWQDSLRAQRQAFNDLLGNTVLTAAMVSYSGVMVSQLRQEAMERWQAIL